MNHDLRLLHLLPAAVLVTQEGAIRFANAASMELLEAPSIDSLIGRLSGDFVHPLDQVRSTNRIQQVAVPEQAGRPNKSSEFRIRTERGNLRMVLISSVAIEWDGAPAVLMCGMDMTHQSEIEAQLRESEQNFRRLFDNMQDVYYRTDAQGIVQHVGPGVRRVLGYEPHEIEGRTAESYYPQSKDRDAFKAAIMEHGEVSDFPGQMVRRDGTVIDISISSHALYDHAGNFAGGLEVATRMLHSIRALELTDDAGHSYRVTTSLGVSTFRQSDRSLRDMLDRADQALYLAKHRGRNQVASLETLGE
eukprot:gene2213-2167_t